MRTESSTEASNEIMTGVVFFIVIKYHLVCHRVIDACIVVIIIAMIVVIVIIVIVVIISNILTKQTKRTMSSVIECAELFFLGAGISLCSAFLRRASSCQCRAEAATTDHCSELFITISSHDRRR